MLDQSQPNVEVLALRQTLRNRRYFLRLADGAKIRIPGMANRDESVSADYILSYSMGELRFQLIPDEEDLEAINHD